MLCHGLLHEHCAHLSEPDRVRPAVRDDVGNKGPVRAVPENVNLLDFLHVCILRKANGEELLGEERGEGGGGRR